MTMRPTIAPVLTALLALIPPLLARPALAGCGCEKAPPPLAAVRPFVGSTNQTITLFDARLADGQPYDVQFVSGSDGTSDWSRARAKTKRDLADGQPRVQLRVRIGDVSLGPCAIRVWSRGALLYGLDDDAFTVAASPVPLRDVAETVSLAGYRAGVGRDGTVYIPVDVGQVSGATTFVANGMGFPLAFSSSNVAMYNAQGFLMQLLDAKSPGLFQIYAGDDVASDTLQYFRHEFRTYKLDHRRRDAYMIDDDPDWHADGTRHVDHDRIVVAIRGTLAGGDRPTPGATAPFELTVASIPAVE